MPQGGVVAAAPAKVELKQRTIVLLLSRVSMNTIAFTHPPAARACCTLLSVANPNPFGFEPYTPGPFELVPETPAPVSLVPETPEPPVLAPETPVPKTLPP